MKYNVKTRFLSLVLCVCMLVPMLTQVIPVFSVGDESKTPDNAETFKNNVGKQAIFDWWSSFDVAPENGSVPGEAITVSYDDSGIAERAFVIVDYYYNENDGSHWYKLSARDGETLPSVLQENPWVLYALDSDVEEGYAPYLCIYEADEEIRFVTYELLTYETDEEGNTVTDDDGNPILLDRYVNYYVFAGPAALKNAEISITERDSDYPISDLAYVELTFGTTFSRAFDITITKSNKEAWTPSDGLVSVRYEAAHFGTDTYIEDCACGAGFVYIENQMYSATSTDRFGFEISDVAYTNSGSFTLVFEIMDSSFEYVGESAYFKNDKVALFSNTFEPESFLAAELPTTFTVAYSFKHVEFDTEYTYYWLENKGFIGSPYFLAKAEDVELGELPKEYGDGRVSVTDKDGEAVDAITLPMYEKPEFEAVSSLTQLTADVKYQWQICYDVDNNLWVDIYGEDSKTVKLSYGMVASLLDNNGMVAIRCKTNSASKVAYSKPIGVTFVITEPKEPTVEISQNVTTSNGTNVDVTVSGNIPADAELNIEDASGVEIGGVEATEITVSLDVTIKQNGAEWQPSDNEKISVSIPASQLGLQDGTYFTVYHIHNGTTELLGPFVVADGYATFEIDGFSVVVISTNYGAALGATAELSQQIILLYSDPMSLKASVTSYTSMPQKLIITDYYFDEGNARLMYKIDAAHGYTWPATLTDKHWCESTDLTNIDVNGTAGVYDADGNPVKDASVTNSAGVVVSAITSLQSADISYRWQICYDTENDLWVNISGQNDKNITIVAGMVISLKDENNQVRVRCVTSAGTKTVITEPVTITILEAQPGNDNVDVLVDGVVKENIQISASELESFNATLSANSSLTGNLTYSWEVLFDKTYDMWWLQGQSETFKPVFDPYKEGVYLDSNFIHVVDDTTSEICIRLTVSDGTTMVRNTFVITVNNDTAVASYNSVLRSVSAPATNEVTARDATSTDIYKIVINYLYYHNMQIAAPAYTSTVGASTQLTDPVVFPTVMGYLPYVMDANGTLVRMDEWEFNGYLTEDFELNVFYQPTTVSYTINIYTQNPEDDNYQLLMTRNGSALTGTVIDAISMPLPGYYQTKMTTTTASVAADGSTVFNLYYDRIYYLMKFDLDGGYGVQPVFARHGVKLDIPNPTKAGYTFVGWDDITSGSGDGIADTLPTEMPVGNKTYKAIWKAVDNAKVTIVYWGENPNDDGYSYKESFEIYAKVGSTLTFGTNQMICTLEEHTHNATCITTCNQQGHTHTDTCYGNCTHKHSAECYTVRVGNNSATLTAVTNTNTITTLNGSNKWGNGVVRTGSGSWNNPYHYYIELDGTWYELSRTVNNNSTQVTVTTPNCSHTHTDACVDCALHVHKATCYPCIAHTHTNSCRLTTPAGDEYDSALWTLRTDKNQPVTVAADGTTVMNVYYDRREYSVEFHRNQSCTNEYTNLRITAKWGASILSKWPTYNGSSSWKVQNKSDTWQNSIQIMPVGGAKFWGPKTGNSSYKAYYYTEALPGDSDTIVYNGVTYVLHHTDTSSSSGNVTDEERYGIEGFTYKEGTANGVSYSNAKFYYTRNKYILEFNNGETIVKTASVPYQANLGSYAFTPTPPSYYEAGSVQFAGWYQNPECTGEEVVLSNTTMPSSNKILYAKWIPVEHDVTIYRYKNDDGSFPTGDDIIQETIQVSHGSFLQPQYIPQDPENAPYNFVGWFYMDGNTEKAFDFKNMPVTKDLQIYAKWSSNVQLPYTIKYVLQGTDTEIAERETGKQFAGETMTFQAKTGDALNPGYKSGYFPTVPSHSIKFDLDDNVPSYEYVFEYVYKDSVPYTVYYLAETLNDGATSYGTMEYNGKTYYKIVADKKVSSRDAIVTENFVQVQGYMPNAYQQSLVLSGADNAVNEIYFFYTVDTEHAYYKVSHYTQNLDGSWYEYSSYESVGVIGSIYTEGPRTINGFTYNSGIEGTLTTGELTAEGLHLKLFYTRNKYPYKVEYRIEGAGTLLATDYFTTEELMRYYNESISVSPSRTFNGYHLVSNSPVGHIIQIEQEANMQNPVANVITFYYAEDEVTIKYEVVGPNGSGTVVPSSQTVPVISGNPMSSADATSAAYKFVGWYSDKNCTQLITDSRIIQPQKVNGLHVEATYYAKFEYNLTSLTIQKKGWEAADPNQTFIFTIAGKDANGNDMVLDVTVHGNGSTTIDGLTVGATYTITEKTDWSWRYRYGGVVTDKTTVNVTKTAVANGAEFTLNPTGNVITFTNERSNLYWLDGDSWCDNIFTTAIARNVNN